MKNKLRSSYKTKGVRLSYLHRNFIYTIFVVLFFSGVSWIYAHYFLTKTSDFEVIKSPIEHLSLVIHGGFSMLFLILFGSLIPEHIQSGLKSKKNKISGIGLILSVGILTISGYGLYYTSSEELRFFCSSSHTILGLIIGVVLLIHIRNALNWPQVPKFK